MNPLQTFGRRTVLRVARLSRCAPRPAAVPGPRLFSAAAPRRAPATATAATMKALVYEGAGVVRLQERARPVLQAPTDALVRMTKTTICGTDLHIRKGDVASCAPGTVLGHEGVGVVEALGASVAAAGGSGGSPLRVGDRVLVSCISACAACAYCRRGMASHCTSGGWILGNTIDGTQAEVVRIPHAATSLYALPPDADDAYAASLVMLSDIFPTGFECGVQNARVAPGATVALVGAGPVGLAALITAQLYSPAQLIVIDRDAHRLRVAQALGATATINNAEDSDDAGAGAQTLAAVHALTGGVGCDAVLEAVGVPASFELAQRLLAPGGTLANVGVHGTSAPLHLETLWDRNVTITTRLVDAVTVPMLLKLVQARRLDPSQLITHKFKFSEMEKAYDTFANASQHDALKVLVEID